MALYALLAGTDTVSSLCIIKYPTELIISIDQRQC
jgi:hypothetical protein